MGTQTRYFRYPDNWATDNWATDNWPTSYQLPSCQLPSCHGTVILIHLYNVPRVQAFKELIVHICVVGSLPNSHRTGILWVEIW